MFLVKQRIDMITKNPGYLIYFYDEPNQRYVSRLWAKIVWESDKL